MPSPAPPANLGSGVAGLAIWRSTDEKCEGVLRSALLELRCELLGIPVPFGRTPIVGTCSGGIVGPAVLTHARAISSLRVRCCAATTVHTGLLLME
jgi:hypothetical protein